MHSSRFHSLLRLFILGPKLLQLGYFISILLLPSFTSYRTYFQGNICTYFTSYRTYFQGNICTYFTSFLIFLHIYFHIHSSTQHIFLISAASIFSFSILFHILSHLFPRKYLHTYFYFLVSHIHNVFHNFYFYQKTTKISDIQIFLVGRECSFY